MPWYETHALPAYTQLSRSYSRSFIKSVENEISCGDAPDLGPWVVASRREDGTTRVIRSMLVPYRYGLKLVYALSRRYVLSMYLESPWVSRLALLYLHVVPQYK